MTTWLPAVLMYRCAGAVTGAWASPRAGRTNGGSSRPRAKWAARNSGQIYFLGALGELIQRMDDPYATYALAPPYNPRMGGLPLLV